MKAQSKQIVITTVIDRAVDQQIEAIAREKRMFKGGVIEAACRDYIEKHKPQGGK